MTRVLALALGFVLGAGLAALAPEVSLAQASFQRAAIGNLTGGGSIGKLGYGRRLYDGGSARWLEDSFPSKYINAAYVLPDPADGTSTGNSDVITYVVDMDGPWVIPCAWVSDLNTGNLATWLTGSFTDNTDNASANSPDESYSAYCQGASVSPGTTVDYGGNCAAAPCLGSMYIPFAIAAAQPEATPGLGPGAIEFVPGTYEDDEGEILTFQLRRVGGSVGACTWAITKGGFAPQFADLNTASVTFPAGSSANQSGTVDLLDVAADATFTLTASPTSGACTAGPNVVVTVTINAILTPEAPGTYEFTGQEFVSNDGANGTIFNRGNAWRKNGSEGAATVEMRVNNGTCIRGTHFQVNAPADAVADGIYTVEYADETDGVDDEQFTFQSLGPDDNCTFTIVFQNATGGWTLAGYTTKTVTLIGDGGGPPDPPPGDCQLFQEYTWVPAGSNVFDFGLTDQGNGHLVGTMVTQSFPNREANTASLRFYLSRFEMPVSYRTELSIIDAPEWFEGTWYGISLYIPANYVISDTWNGPFFQSHDWPYDGDNFDNDPPGEPAFDTAFTGEYNANPHLYLTIGDLNDDATPWRFFGKLFRAHQQVGDGQLGSTSAITFEWGSGNPADVVGQWHDIVQYIDYDYRRPEDGGTGDYDLWYRRGNEAWTHVFDMTAVAPNHGIGHNTDNPDDGLGGENQAFTKMGMYKGEWANPTFDSVSERTWLHGPLRIGRASSGCEFDDVAPRGAIPTQTYNDPLTPCTGGTCP